MNSDYEFVPVVFETSGALNKEGETVLTQIIRFASKREGITHTVYAARAWARLSCCVQAASAQQILNRDFVVAQRLNRLDSPHANAWLSARPSCMDGTDTVLPPRIYRTAVARLLG